MPPNADYGNGIFRRRIRLDGEAGVVRAALEDNLHGMRCAVFHDGERVIDIQSESLRVPFNTCGGAITPLRALIGQSIERSERELGQHAVPRRNCTHLLDLTLLAIAHAARGIGVRQYDVAVTDETEQQGSRATVHRDGVLIHEWLIRESLFVEPARWAGQAVLSGFAKWAGAAYSGDELEAARVLQKGYFVACARRYDVGSMDGGAAIKETSMLGSCHTYSDGVVEHAYRHNHTVRDFTHDDTALLRFL